jgi:ribosome-associated heat shock protein Hsp15
MSDETTGRQRIDKWLWFARVVKSRTLAQKLAVSGDVRVNRERNTSASRALKVGDTLTIALASGVRILRVAQLGARRGPAPEARTLYADLTPPAPEAAPSTPPSGARPTKRARRAIDALRRRSGDDFS